MRKIAGIFWAVVGIGTVLGFGVLIWFLCRPGYSIPETLLFVVGAYALLGFCCYALSFPGACAIPVKWDITTTGRVNNRFFFRD